MPPTTMEERLAVVSRKIDTLQERARAGKATATLRLQHQLDELRQEQASARSAIRRAGVEAEGKLGQLDTRLDIAEQSVAAELSENQQSFVNAVTKMVGAWDNALERLQTKAAAQPGDVRKQAEAQISELRATRNALAASLRSAGTQAGEGWQERKKRILVSADEVGRRIDELWTKLDGGKS